MNFTPGDFFLGIVDFLGVLVPSPRPGGGQQCFQRRLGADQQHTAAMIRMSLVAYGLRGCPELI